MTDELVLDVEVHGKVEPRGSKSAFPRYRDRKLRRPMRRDGGNITCEACGETDGPIIVDVADSNPKSKAWMEHVAQTVVDEMQRLNVHPVPSHMGVRFEATTYVKRPQAHWRGNSAELRPDAPAYPATRPDADKLVRGTIDALTSVLWEDDGQAVEVVTRKRYAVPTAAGENLRCRVQVWVLGVQHASDLPEQERRRSRPLAEPDGEQESLLLV